MKNKELSPYKDNVIASRGKIVLMNVADYLVTMIMTFLTYIIMLSTIFSSLPSTKANKEAIVNSQTNLRQIVGETHLQGLKSGGNELYSIDEMSESFLLTYAKTSYFLNDEEFPYKANDGYAKKNVTKEETFLEKEYLKDPLGYYFYFYKPNQETLNSYIYDGIDYSANKDDYFFLKASMFEKDAFENYFEKKTEDISIYRQLTLDKATLLSDYLVYGERGDDAKKVYQALSSSFKNAQNIFVNEVESLLPSYVAEYSVFLAKYQELNLDYIISYFIAYCFSFLISEFVMPLFLKKNRTIGVFFFKLVYQNIDDTELGISNLIRKGAIRFLLQLSCLFLVAAISSSQGIYFIKFGSFFTFFYVLIFSFILDIISIVMTLITHTHQGAAELISGIIVKDPSSFDKRIKEKGMDDDGKTKQGTCI